MNKQELWDKLPQWAKILALALVVIGASIASLFSLTSCGSTTRVTTRTKDSANVNISITAPSTTDTDVSVDAQPSVTITKTSDNTYRYTINKQ